MATKLRLLTKSRFKTGCECPTKLYFTGKSEYANSKLDNSFLEALAEGGFQVGELAKMYFHGGITIETLDTLEAISETQKHLEADSVILYEPALRAGNLLVRVDILIKRGDNVELIEVKAKSFDPDEDDAFYNKAALKKGLRKLSSEWEPYLLDIAFQTFVANAAFPKWTITSSLMLADKSAVATVDGLNQKFFLHKDSGGRTRAEVAAGTIPEDLGAPILTQLNVDDEVKLIFEQGIDGIPFAEHVANLANLYEKTKMAPATLGIHCKTCEFRVDPAKANGLKIGFETCWTTATGRTPSALAEPLIFEIWNFRKSQKLIEDGRFFIRDVEKADISPRPREEGSGLSSSERQWLQVEKVIQEDLSPYLDFGGLTEEMGRFRFPLHFIDFETTMAAIPFNSGRRPYEQIAFQFSHHVISEDGTIEHRSQFINTERGKFPNFEFVRNLRRALSSDDGTIFRYAAHENTVLCQIYDQLRRSKEPDRQELMEWIKTVTTSGKDKIEKWIGKRNMVDMCELVKQYFYHPYTRGSNSIKKILPAILGTSEFLQNRYSKPIYGAASGIVSKNYSDWTWIKKTPDGSIQDPYKLLPELFADLDQQSMDSLITDGSIADGGAAMTAYARMQFTQMTDLERERVVDALLKYCELDTFAMVLIYEYWKHELAESGTKAA